VASAAAGIRLTFLMLYTREGVKSVHHLFAWIILASFPHVRCYYLACKASITDHDYLQLSEMLFAAKYLTHLQRVRIIQVPDMSRVVNRFFRWFEGGCWALGLITRLVP